MINFHLFFSIVCWGTNQVVSVILFTFQFIASIFWTSLLTTVPDGLVVVFKYKTSLKVQNIFQLKSFS